VLKAYASYYNRVRTHLSLDKDAPLFRRAHRSATSPQSLSLADCTIDTSGYSFFGRGRVEKVRSPKDS
jgi:hypothetical protein